MRNDKICPICGGLMVYRNKHYGMITYLCLHCGHIEVMEWNDEKIIV